MVNMRYYKIVCCTPFVGEENTYYIKASNHEDLVKQIDDCVYENGMEWLDDETLDFYDTSEDDYFAECGCRDVEEISIDEYLEANPWEA